MAVYDESVTVNERSTQSSLTLPSASVRSRPEQGLEINERLLADADDPLTLVGQIENEQEHQADRQREQPVRKDRANAVVTGRIRAGPAADAGHRDED